MRQLMVNDGARCDALDLFNRIIDQRWQNGITGTPADLDRYQYGYDQDSNRLYKANVVGTPIISGGLDEFYSYDHLNRLVEMQRGTLNSGKTGITGTPTVEQDWTLDPTGNWPGFITKASGTTNLNQTRTSNTVNEITNITESVGSTWIVPAYDAAGNTTTMPQPGTPTSSYVAVYDAWNRMVKISAGGSTVATYAYDGRNRRIVKVTISPSETRHFYFTDNWQDVEERVGTSSSMDKQYVWGIRYIDELVCRDDATPQRLYASQDANFNLTSIANTSGVVQERYLFDPYGNRTIMNASWAVVSASSYSWVVGYQGLSLDIESAVVQARFRRLQSGLGCWIRRDPIHDQADFKVDSSATASARVDRFPPNPIRKFPVQEPGIPSLLQLDRFTASQMLHPNHDIFSHSPASGTDANLYLFCGLNPVRWLDPTGLQYLYQGAVNISSLFGLLQAIYYCTCYPCGPGLTVSAGIAACSKGWKRFFVGCGDHLFPPGVLGPEAGLGACMTYEMGCPCVCGRAGYPVL